MRHQFYQQTAAGLQQVRRLLRRSATIAGGKRKMVREIALVEEGARMHHATSYHEDYMPKNVIDRGVGGAIAAVTKWENGTCFFFFPGRWAGPG